MKFISKSFFVVSITVILFLGNSYVVEGQSNPPSGSVSNPTLSTGAISNPSGTGAVSNPSGFGFRFENPLKVSTICGLIQKLLTAILVLGTPVAVLAMVYAGFMFVLARGNAEKLVKAQKNLLYVLMGIAIFFGSWVLGQVIANTINTIKPGTVNSSNSCN